MIDLDLQDQIFILKPFFPTNWASWHQNSSPIHSSSKIFITGCTGRSRLFDSLNPLHIYWSRQLRVIWHLTSLLFWIWLAVVGTNRWCHNFTPSLSGHPFISTVPRSKFLLKWPCSAIFFTFHGTLKFAFMTGLDQGWGTTLALLLFKEINVLWSWLAKVTVLWMSWQRIRLPCTVPLYLCRMFMTISVSLSTVGLCIKSPTTIRPKIENFHMNDFFCK